MRFDGLNFLIVHHHFVKFSSHRPCGSSDTIAKKVNVTLQDYVTTRLYGKKLLTVYLHPVTKLIAIEIVLVDICFLVCQVILQVILQDHVVIWSCDFMDRGHSRQFTNLSSFVVISIAVVEVRYF